MANAKFRSSLLIPSLWVASFAGPLLFLIITGNLSPMKTQSVIMGCLEFIFWFVFIFLDLRTTFEPYPMVTLSQAILSLVLYFIFVLIPGTVLVIYGGKMLPLNGKKLIFLGFSWIYWSVAFLMFFSGV